MATGLTTIKINKFYIKLLTLFLSVITLMTVFTYLYMQQPQFAQLPSTSLFSSHGLKANYVAGIFENEIPTPILTRKVEQNRIVSLSHFLFDKDEDAIPAAAIPSVKTNLFQLNPAKNAVVWMGHSSYYLQIDGLRILIDPVFSENASPVPATNVAFKGSNVYTVQDIPDIDYLLITHDHWDHLDYPTVMGLKSKIQHVITPLGVGSYFQQWGFEKSQIQEGDWYSVIKGKNNSEIHILPARHFSGRLLTRNKTLWGSFALITQNHRIYLGGDSGYGPQFKEIGRRFGRFDLAILESGQYNSDWKYIHMTPEETATAATDLNAAALLPSHNSKFKLAHHTWFEPLDRIMQASQNKAYRLLTPMIGELIETDNSHQKFNQWWRSETRPHQ